MGLKRHTPRRLPRQAEHRCLNCDSRYEGDFCPRCGQSAKTARLTWRRWWHNILEVWGVSNTPFIRTITGLLYRPGHLIGDFLEGKRIRYFSPSKTLFLVAAALALLRLVFPGIVDQPETTPENASELNLWINNIMEKSENYANQHILLWLGLGHAALLFPIKFFFRNAPLHPRLTTPEHIFIQVFLITQLLLLSIIWTFIVWGNFHQTEIYIFPSWLILIVFTFDFKQLFGYSWWGTIWRTVTATFVGFILGFVFVLLILILLSALHLKGFV